MVVFKVHQMHKTETSAPAALRVFQETVKMHTPQYEYNFWTDAKLDALVDKEFPQYAELYYSLTPKIKRIDMAKYLVIYKFGGWYMDMDLELFRDPTDLIQGRSVVLCDPAVFYSEPGHPFWLNVFDHIARYKGLFVIQATGPDCLKSVFRRSTFDADEVAYIPEELFLPMEHEPLSWNFWRKDDDDLDVCRRKYGTVAYGCHRNNGSWIESYWYMIAIPIVFLLIVAAVSCFAACNAKLGM